MSVLENIFLDVRFKNPLVLPSGIIQEIPAHKRAVEAGAGGVVTKSLTVEPREGNSLPRVIKYEKIGYLNSVGLRNPGIQKGVGVVSNFIKSSDVPTIVSVFASNVGDFKILAKEILTANPKLLELNLSCPNTIDELGVPLGIGVESTTEAVSAVKKIVGNKIKIIAKLSPNVQNIGEIAKAAEAAGADAISAINTVGPGMIIDIERKRPILGNLEGGVSGAAIKPIAIRCVYDIYRVVKIPILGLGGLSSWQDVVEMMLAGASLVGIGSAYYMNKNVYKEINKGLLEYAKELKLSNLSEIVGAAHK